MSLKEVKSRAQLINDHVSAQKSGQFGEEELVESRRNSVKKFMSFIESMQTNGQWVILLRSHFVPRATSYKVPQSQEEEDKMIGRLSQQKRFGETGRRGKQSRLRPTQVAPVTTKAGRVSEPKSISPDRGQRAFISISASNRFEPNF
jgi:hypothetical protein